MAKDTTAHPVTGEIELPKNQSTFETPAKWHEVVGFITLLVALFLLLSLISYDGLTKSGSPIPGENLLGVAGEWSAYIALTMFGFTAYLLDLFMWIGAASLFLSRIARVRPKMILGMFFIGLFSSIILHTIFKGDMILGGHSPGGFLGALLGEFLISLVSTVGTYLISVGGIILITIIITDISISSLVRYGVGMMGVGTQELGAFGLRVIRTWRSGEDGDDREGIRFRNPFRRPDDDDKKSKKKTKENKKDKSPSEEVSASDIKIVTKRPRVKNSNSKETSKERSIEINSRPIKGTFQLPPTSLLVSPPNDESGQSEIDEQNLKSMAERLVEILSDFNVYGEVKEIHPGPVVTMFEFQPKSGTKLSKIGSLSNEIAMALEVVRVRVVAPIPGKNAVGFELPNAKREKVYLQEMLNNRGFANRKLKLPLALGKDISGAPYFVDLDRMPHLLIAGTTGSGKSVSLNAMLLSLLYKYTPDDLRLLLVDPKMIELGIYDKIPHLLLPVVTDMSKACLTLKWAVDEMERRYQLFADVGARNLAGYNAKIAKLKAGQKGNKKQTVKPEDVIVVSDASDNPEKLDKLPFVVIVVDELADLMMVAAKDVETSITRLAQKARASGIHLIIATQRPSVDVITGLIKANFPSRISFRVSSGHDSRTIISTHGAENLLGMGDMLILPPGTSDLTRVHGAYVDEDEICEIVNFLKTQGVPEYRDEILKPRDDDDGEFDDAEKDEMYDKAVQIVADAQVCSISMLQRRLRIGYNRSARIVEIMEKQGVVGKANGVNKREVLISPSL
jgi:S-DNA-T family DNA segregation ATPase FtsK/SpoIIIE